MYQNDSEKIETPQPPSSTISLGLVEFENDRNPTEPILTAEVLNFESIETLNRLSYLLSRRELLYTILLISNFKFSPAEIQNQTKELLKSSGCIDESIFKSLDDYSMVSSRNTKLGEKAGFLKSRKNIATVTSDDKRQFKRPVYSLKDDSIFTMGIIAVKLLKEFQGKYPFPEKTEESKVTLFTRQIISLMIMDELGEISLKDYCDLTGASDVTNVRLLNHLFKEGVLEKKATNITINRRNLAEYASMKHSPEALLKLFGSDEEEITIPYSDLKKHLLKEFFEIERDAQHKEEHIFEIISYLSLLKKKGVLTEESTWRLSDNRDQEFMGKGEYFKLSANGREFLLRTKGLFANPNIIGQSNQFYRFKESRLLSFYELDEKYKELLLFALQRLT